MARHYIDLQLVDLTRDRPGLVDQAAALLCDAFRGRTSQWQDLESARREVVESLTEGKISRVALENGSAVVGWIGAMPMCVT